MHRYSINIDNKPSEIRSVLGVRMRGEPKYCLNNELLEFGFRPPLSCNCLRCMQIIIT